MLLHKTKPTQFLHLPTLAHTSLCTSGFQCPLSLFGTARCAFFGMFIQQGAVYSSCQDGKGPTQNPECSRGNATGPKHSLEGEREEQDQPAASLLSAAVRRRSSQSSSPQPGLVAKTSLTSPPWPEVKLPDPVEEAKYHAEVVRKVNGLISAGQYGRLFAVVHFASKQWKITSEDLIMMDNVLEAECGDRIRMEKVLLVGADDFTLIGRPLLGKDLVRVEATVIEKTESWPKVNMRFWRRHNYQRKKIIANPQTVLRINTIEIYPCLS